LSPSGWSKAGERRTGAARELPVPPFRSRFPWLTGDLQTVRNAVLRPAQPLSAWPAERLWLSVSGGDQLAACLHAPARLGEAPLVVLIHGLTGCEDSTYLRASARYWLAEGWPVLRLNLRGSPPSRPRCAGHYHGGRSADLRDALTALLARAPELSPGGICPVGYSLGGNMLIKFLAESGRDFPIRAAATVSAPIDLAATSRRFLAPRNRPYHRWLLRHLKREALRPPAALSEAERAAIAAARTVHAFDDTFVAPRHGFADAADYYARCSALAYLPEVTVPLLAVHALDDPWIPAKMYRRAEAAAPAAVAILLAGGGGHVGFHAADDAVPWHDRALGAFLRRAVREARPPPACAGRRSGA